MKHLTIFVIHSPQRPKQWLDTCLTSLKHKDIHVELIKGTKTLSELLKLRLTLPKLCTTKYMSFVDDDDWVDPKHIRPMLELLDQDVWGGVYSNEYLVSQEGRIIGHRDSFMKIFDPLVHYRRLIDTHHLTIVRTDLAQKAVAQIPKDYIFLEPVIYGLIGLQMPLIHYPHRAYFWRQSTPTKEKLEIQNKATKNASALYLKQIKMLNI